MSNAALLGFVKEGFHLAVLYSVPLLATCLVTGVVVSLLQALTQVQDQSVSFVPKAAAVGLVVVLAGPAALRGLSEFARAVFLQIARM